MRRVIAGAVAGLFTAWLIAWFRQDLELAVAAGTFAAVTVWFRPPRTVGGRR